MKPTSVKAPNNFVGWISEKHRIAWVVSPWRKDKRTGVIPCENKKTPSHQLEASSTALSLAQRFGC